MLDVQTFKKFIGEANRTHQQFCVWFNTNNKFAEHQERWNEWGDKTPFPTEKFTKRNGCKYKNFWGVATGSMQHGWIIGIARLFDPAFHPWDKKKEKPRISFDYILLKLDDTNLANSLREQLVPHQLFIDSVKKHRNNALAHIDFQFEKTRIEGGVEKLFEWLEEVIAEIKKSELHLSNCGIINVKYNEILSKCGVEEVFGAVLMGEREELPDID